MSSPITQSSSTNPCSSSVFDESTSSTKSSSSTSETRLSSNSGREKSISKPSYMSLAESNKAKRRWVNYYGHKPSPLSKGVLARRSADTDLYSSELGKDLYPPMFLDRYDEVGMIGFVEICLESDDGPLESPSVSGLARPKAFQCLSVEENRKLIWLSQFRFGLKKEDKKKLMFVVLCSKHFFVGLS
nr:hypothetical protein [Tanacetum cinerariifolium]